MIPDPRTIVLNRELAADILVSYMTEYSVVIPSCNSEKKDDATHPGLTGRRIGRHSATPGNSDLEDASDSASETRDPTTGPEGETLGVVLE